MDRTGLADGTYTGVITVDASATGTASVSVVMAVLAGAGTANAGFHYVLVIDPETFDAVAQFDADAVDGEYAFALADVPSGSYLLYAGSDTDNDFFICGTGEACGAYPTLGSPELIEMNGDRFGPRLRERLPPDARHGRGERGRRDAAGGPAPTARAPARAAEAQEKSEPPSTFTFAPVM